MRNLMYSLSALLAAIFACAPTAAAQRPLERSLLWEISGNGLQQPSYIYGTMHLMCPGDFAVSDKTRRVFASTGKLVLEVNMFDPNELVVLQQKMLSDTPQSVRLSPERYAWLDSLLQKQAGVPLKPFDNFRLSVLAALMAQKAFSCDSTRSYEEEFKNMADSRHITLSGLETMEEEADYFNKAFTDEYVLQQLTGFDDMKKETLLSVQYYKAEDVEAMYKMMTADKSMDEQSRYWLLEVRNANWVQRMPAIMKAGSTFFAVGAGHLAGEKGVIRLLRAGGYTVKPVME
ncbi:TraB/GumN family protein [Chitinophaga agrisoli]|uniref:TraB/GumN family protein n=1 Tax=Chitinophaga agrisoli TaxID=2607653 RepID=A0A5B2VQC9_9BACT|nr:TraB/GumN family protein [Chitinophaga agrisoli]KAA2240868.1 TraB/GumN family protein [Chitinophaga agrisoli]